MVRELGVRSIWYWMILMASLLIQPAYATDEITFSSGKRQVQLVELFTSQGCSSCPPADRWLNDFVSDRRLWNSIIPVAFHVDYWDYLGWRDIYASTAYSDRQRRYRAQGGVRSVYTPGFVVDGREWRGWFARNPVPSHITPADELSAVLGQQGLRVSYPGNEEKLVLHIAILGFGIETPVQAGENEGSRLKHEFVVLAHQRHESRKGAWEVALPQVRARGAERFGIALWVSYGDRQMPLQATGGWLPQDRIRPL